MLFIYTIRGKGKLKDNKKEPEVRRNDREEKESQRHHRGDERVRKEYSCHQMIGSTSKNGGTKHEQKIHALMPIFSNLSAGAASERLEALKTKSQDKSEELDARRFFPFEMYLFCEILKNVNSLKLISPFNTSHGSHLTSNLPS